MRRVWGEGGDEGFDLMIPNQAPDCGEEVEKALPEVADLPISASIE
jgi:hypothetical protein